MYCVYILTVGMGLNACGGMSDASMSLLNHEDVDTPTKQNSLSVNRHAVNGTLIVHRT